MLHIFYKWYQFENRHTIRYFNKDHASVDYCVSSKVCKSMSAEWWLNRFECIFRYLDLIYTVYMNMV
jgi:hypothetical protein